MHVVDDQTVVLQMEYLGFTVHPANQLSEQVKELLGFINLPNFERIRFGPDNKKWGAGWASGLAMNEKLRLDPDYLVRDNDYEWQPENEIKMFLPLENLYWSEDVVFSIHWQARPTPHSRTFGSLNAIIIHIHNFRFLKVVG